MMMMMMKFGAILPETNIAPKNGWLEYDPFLLGFRPIFRGELLVGSRTTGNFLRNDSHPILKV